MRYAESTQVSSDKSRSEIESTLRRYGATAFAYGWGEDRAMVSFQANGRSIKFILPLPNPNDAKFKFTPGRHVARSAKAQHDAYEQAVRQKWRALALAIKAKLEAVESKIATFEDEFLAYVVLPNGQTVGEFTRPQIASAYEHGTMPKLLPGAVESEVGI